MADKTDMNKLIRRARGLTVGEMQEEAEEEGQPLDLNARLRAAWGIEVKQEADDDRSAS